MIRSDLKDHSRHNGVGGGTIKGCRATKESTAVTQARNDKG